MDKFVLRQNEFDALAANKKQNYEGFNIEAIVEKFDAATGLRNANPKIQNRFYEFTAHSIQHGFQTDVRDEDIEKYIYYLFNFIVECCYQKIFGRDIYQERRDYIEQATGLRMNTKRSMITMFVDILKRDFSDEELCIYFD